MTDTEDTRLHRWRLSHERWLKDPQVKEALHRRGEGAVPNEEDRELVEGPNIESRLKAVRQEIVKYIDSGADRSHTVSIPQGKLEGWFDGLEAISGHLPAQPQESLTEEHS